MSDIVESAGRGMLALAKWVVIYGFVEFFLYGCGYITLKLICFGKYPESKQQHKNLCITVGLVVFITAISVVSVFNSQ